MRSMFVRSAVAMMALGAFAAPATSQAQTADFVPEVVRGEAFELSIRNIMRGPEHVGSSPNAIRFTQDGEWIYFRWLPGGSEWDTQARNYRVRASGGTPEEVSDEQMEAAQMSLNQGQLSADGRRRLINSGGDIYVQDVRSGEMTRLTETSENESGAQFMPNGGVMYRQGDNLYSIHDGMVRQITDIRSGNPPRAGGAPEPEGLDKFLRDQQIELFDHIRRQTERQAEQQAAREAAMADQKPALYIPQAERLGGINASPDGSYALVSSFIPSQGGRQVMVPDWVTPTGYTEELNTRTKVGDVSSSGALRFYNTMTGESMEISGEPDGYTGGSTWSVNSQGWNDAGTHALIQSRTDDDTEWALFSVEGATGTRTLLDRHYDEAWVGGPCGFGCVGWLPGTSTAYYASEETGYAHIYRINADGTGKRALTSGNWEVRGLQLRADEERFFITTSEDSPHNTHIGFMSFDGEIEYLTSGVGRYSGTLSPDGERIAITREMPNRPGELYLADTDDADDMEQITDTPTDEWKSFDWLQPEIVNFRAEDGTMVPARIYRPEEVGGTSNGAAVVFVHGAGYLQNVHNGWSSYFREFMFHHLLAAQGYTVLDIDYRGSAGYGSAWRTGIYRWMGGKDLSDQVDGARYLVANEGIDASRIGIYGGSYGGFITLMALFTAENTFRSGAALRSVTDWAHYNDGYTSNILNDPQEDEEAYRQSSPIYFAENFRDDQHLLILHGMVDTNVHFSDVVRLAQRLIELGKENWEFAVYPVESHGFVEPTSWTDEYRRIFELFERTISAPGCTAGGALCSLPGGM